MSLIFSVNVDTAILFFLFIIITILWYNAGKMFSTVFGSVLASIMHESNGKILTSPRKRRDLIQWIRCFQNCWRAKGTRSRASCHWCSGLPLKLGTPGVTGTAGNYSCLWYRGGCLAGTQGSCCKTLHPPNPTCLPTHVRGAVSSGFLSLLHSCVDGSHWWSPV